MSVYSWGRGVFNQLGLSDSDHRHQPVAIEALQGSRVVQISCGMWFTAVLTAEGDVYTWGDGGMGKLGHGDNSSKNVPRLVNALRGKMIRQVTCGNNHMAAVTVSGDLYTWGNGTDGKLGHGNIGNYSTPYLVEALSGREVRQVACGDNHTVVLLENRDVYICGCTKFTWFAHFSGWTSQLRLVKKLRSKDIVQISACRNHTAALSESGGVFTFGKGKYGRLGHSSEDNEETPRFLEAFGGKRVKQVDCGGYHTAAVMETGELYTWGYNGEGQLGHGDAVNKLVPTLVGSLAGKRAIQVTCGLNHTVALTDTGEIYTCGGGKFGKLGHNTTNNVALPKLVAALKGKRVASVASYEDHTLALVDPIIMPRVSKRILANTEDMLQLTESVELSDTPVVSVLLNAARTGSVEATKDALQAGESVETRDACSENETPLIWAAIRGHVDVMKLLLDANADIDARTKFGSTALKRAADCGRLEAVRVLLDRGADVDLPNRNGFTALHDAAFHGYTKVIELLLDRKVNADAKTSKGCTPLERAAHRGYPETVEALLDYGAAVDPVNSNGCTPLMVAAKAGQVEVVQLLLERKADHSRRFYAQLQWWTPLKLAQHNRRAGVAAVIEEFQARHTLVSKNFGDGPRTSSSYTSTASSTATTALSSELKSTKSYGSSDDISMAPTTSAILLNDNQLHHEESSSLDDVKPSIGAKLAAVRDLCASMVETRDICQHVCSRLESTLHELEGKPATPSDGVEPKFEQIIDNFYAFVVQHAESKSAVERLVSTRTIVGLLREFHRRIDGLTIQASSEPPTSAWQQQWEADALAVERRLISDMEASAGRIECEVSNDEGLQKDALTLLLYEMQRHKTKYSAEMQRLLSWVQGNVIRISVVSVDKVPRWFIPSHEVEMQEQIAAGAFGTVYRGKWRKLRVVVKCVGVKSSEDIQTFVNEANLWHKARHANIVNFFGACHKDKHCFFVCEEAAEGNLVDFLYHERKSGRCSVWQKLHQAALGLYFLHEEQIVHGDLKGNNILVGHGNKAMLTDFGLSSLAEEATPAVGSVGALRWKAPECIRKGDDRSAPTFESDVYSFGMCVVEAVTGQVPWGSLPDVSIRWHLLRKKEPLKRPKALENDEHWALVEAMCALEPSERMKLEDVIDRLEAFAEQEKLEQREQHRS